MPHDAHTPNACGEIMSGLLDSFMMKLALQSVGDQSPIRRRLVAEDFTARVFMKFVGDQSAPIRRYVDFLKNLCNYVVGD